ncbi:sugar kinase [Georgenia yuyongxinii]|uniref:Sugar kinase n=1 Tax=Georgenia yuyongxinii TaxID=2589797 RepID=A0A5B8BYI4_9MICO|nr:sugar kinase [Georgenia yuyongxinii]QDC23438.1 sugar kinase [Georgenia yuyongxinii]
MSWPRGAHTPPEVVCIGETMAMVTTSDASPVATGRTFTMSAGGAESNVAQHLAGLGIATAWASAVGNDPLGRRVVTQLESHGVDARWVRRDPEAPTGLYVKDPAGGVYYYRKGSAASRMRASDIPDWPVAGARLVHLTGITSALSPSCRALVPAVIDTARSNAALVSFDVNHRPALWPAEEAATVLRPLAASADVVLVGRDEAERLWGTPTAEEIAGLFPEARYVVVKDGAKEAVEFHRRDRDVLVTRVPARRVAVVEPVGAGDAFAGGYLGALLRGDSPADRLAMGHSVAAWVLGSPDDFRPGHGPRVRDAE